MITPSFENWLIEGLQRFEKLTPERVEQIRAEIAQRSLLNRAYLNWRDSSTYSAQIPSEEFAPNRWRIFILGKAYSGKKVGNKLVISIPNSLVKHPAWNPLESKKLAAMAKNHTLAYKKRFPAVVGLDGNFYLTDGNKRFALLPEGISVSVKLAFPPKTVSLSQYLDLIGAPQPTAAEVIDIFEGRLNPIGLLPIERQTTAFPILNP